MMPGDMDTTLVCGERSWRVGSGTTEAFVTETGAHAGPVFYNLGSRAVRPYNLAPWFGERLDVPPLLRVLRGDFFAMPFGESAEPFEGRVFPAHGQTANEKWTLLRSDGGSVTVGMQLTNPPAKVERTVRTLPGQAALYQKQVISGLSGPMSYGMHAMLRFRSRGLISTSPIVYGQVCPVPFEVPAKGGYQFLKQGAEFESLSAAPTTQGGTADLTEYPAREGYEDLVQVVNRPGEELAWSAVVFPEERYAWVQLKDPRALTTTVFWMSNGGRHYSPWNGRHRGVLGVEEVTSYSHLGLPASAADNPIVRLGVPTVRQFTPEEPFAFGTIHAVFETPEGFGRVASVEPSDGGVVVVSETGAAVRGALDLGFLRGR